MDNDTTNFDMSSIDGVRQNNEGAEGQSANQSQDPLVQEEQKAYVKTHEDYLRIAKLRSYNQDISERRKYAELIFGMLCIWLLFVGVVTLLVALKWAALTETVMVTMLSTTTVNVLGVFIIVVRYIFKSKESSEKAS